MNLKCSMDIPLYLPSWTFTWQVRHSGICFLLILAACLSNGLSFTFRVLMCLMWCISMSCEELQHAQGWPNALIVEIFQSRAERGSSKTAVPKKRIGARVRSGHAKSRNTILPSLLRIFRLTFGPNESSKAIFPIFLFRQIVLRRLYLRIQWIFASFFRLSTKL